MFTNSTFSDHALQRLDERFHITVWELFDLLDHAKLGITLEADDDSDRIYQVLWSKADRAVVVIRQHKIYGFIETVWTRQLFKSVTGTRLSNEIIQSAKVREREWRLRNTPDPLPVQTQKPMVKSQVPLLKCTHRITDYGDNSNRVKDLGKLKKTDCKEFYNHLTELSSIQLLLRSDRFWRAVKWKLSKHRILLRDVVGLEISIGGESQICIPSACMPSG